MATLIGNWVRLISSGPPIGLNTWGTLASIPAAQSGFIEGGYGTASNGTDIYVLNGAYGTAPTTRLYRYTIASNTWSLLTQTTVSQRWGMWGAFAGGDLYFGGGRFIGASSAQAFRYNVATNTWTTLAPYSSGVGRYRAAQPIGTSIYLSGYLNDSNVASASPFIAYDYAANTWATLSSAFAPSTHGQVLGVVSGKLVAAAQGGSNTGGREYDPATNAWTNLAVSTHLATNYLQGGQDSTGCLVVAGGATALNAARQPTAVTSATVKYDRGTNTWAALAAMPAGVAQGGSAMSADRTKLYVIGGTNGSAFQSGVYIYNT